MRVIAIAEEEGWLLLDKVLKMLTEVVVCVLVLALAPTVVLLRETEVGCLRTY